MYLKKNNNLGKHLFDFTCIATLFDIFVKSYSIIEFCEQLAVKGSHA